MAKAQTINVQFGDSGVTEFNAADFFLQALINDVDYEISSDKIRFVSDNKNYVEVGGSFVTDGGKNPLDYVEEINSYKFVVNGKVSYQVTGLEIDGDTLGSFGKLGRYLDEHAYNITGNAAANLLSAGSSDDVINGGKGNDTIEGNSGDDFLIGGIGRDTFVFHKGDDQDEIKDFTVKGKMADEIDLSDYGEKLRFKDIDISREGKHDAVIEIGKHDEILLHNVNAKELTIHNFDF